MGLIVGLGMALSVKSCYLSMKTSSDYQNQKQKQKIASHACNQPQCWKLWDKDRWVLKLINQTALPNQISGIVESHQNRHPASLHIHIHMKNPQQQAYAPHKHHTKSLSHTTTRNSDYYLYFVDQETEENRSWIILVQGFCLAPGFKTRYIGYLSKLRCPSACHCGIQL